MKRSSYPMALFMAAALCAVVFSGCHVDFVLSKTVPLQEFTLDPATMLGVPEGDFSFDVDPDQVYTLDAGEICNVSEFLNAPVSFITEDGESASPIPGVTRVELRSFSISKIELEGSQEFLKELKALSFKLINPKSREAIDLRGSWDSGSNKVILTPQQKVNWLAFFKTVNCLNLEMTFQGAAPTKKMNIKLSATLNVHAWLYFF